VGLNSNTQRQVERALSVLETARGQLIKGEIGVYMKGLEGVFGTDKTLLGCSDIIESYFGKFKQKVNTTSVHGLSELVLTIANLGADFNKEQIKAALEQVKCKDLQNWHDKKLCLMKQKQKIMAKNGT
jgi:hypothetical protein